MLCTQGSPGNELYLLLDGLLSVEVDGELVAEVGPGAIIGERALLEGGLRTSTMRVVTKARVAVSNGDNVDRVALAGIADLHRRDSQPSH